MDNQYQSQIPQQIQPIKKPLGAFIFSAVGFVIALFSLFIIACYVILTLFVNLGGPSSVSDSVFQLIIFFGAISILYYFVNPFFSIVGFSLSFAGLFKTLDYKKCSESAIYWKKVKFSLIFSIIGIVVGIISLILFFVTGGPLFWMDIFN